MTANADAIADVSPLFDANGRRIPANLTAAAHQAVRRRFICNQPVVDYEQIHDRITRHLDCGGAISVEAFRDRSEAILRTLHADERISDITKAVRVPFFLPLVPEASQRDIGDDLDHIYLPAVNLSFTEKFPNYNFVNHHKGSLAKTLGIAAGSRHERLSQAIEHQTVVGYLFVSLTEYSVPAAIEQVATLPASFLLAGGVDLCAAVVGSPDLLFRTDGYPPLLWFAGLTADDPNAGYHLEAYGYNLTFNRRVHRGDTAEYWASALTVLG